jgi:hypothetical protein
MPDFLPPDQVQLSVESGVPTMTLDGLRLAEFDGWSVLNRTTLILLDGPADAGFLIPRVGRDGSDLAPAGWDQALDALGAVEVVLRESSERFRAPSFDHPA